MESNKKQIYIEAANQDLEAWFDNHNEPAVKEYIKSLPLKDKIIDVYKKVKAKQKAKKEIAREGKIAGQISGETRSNNRLKTGASIDLRSRTTLEGQTEEQKIDDLREEAKDEVNDKIINMDSMIAYKIALDDLHIAIMDEYKRQIAQRDLNPTEEGFERIIELKQQLTKARGNYQSEYEDKELKYENDLKAEEQKIDKMLRASLRKDIDSIEALQKKLDDTLYNIEKLNYQVKKGELSYDSYKEQYEPLDKKRLELSWEISKQNPQLLEQQEKISNSNKNKQTEELGDIGKLETKTYNIDNIEDAKKIDHIYNPNSEIVTGDTTTRQDRKDEFQKDEEEMAESVVTEMENDDKQGSSIKVAQDIEAVKNKIIDIQATRIQDGKSEKRDVDEKSKITKIGYGDLKETENKKEVSQELAKQVSEQLVEDAVAAEYAGFIAEEKEAIEVEEKVAGDEDIVEPEETTDELHDAFIQQLGKDVVNIEDIRAALKYNKTIEAIDEKHAELIDIKQKQAQMQQAKIDAEDGEAI